LGDLNYRIDRAIVDGRKREHETHHSEVRSLVERKEWRELAAADQLREQMRKGKVFADWQEAGLTFPPTFKLAMKYDTKYDKDTHPMIDQAVVLADGDEAVAHEVEGTARGSLAAGKTAQAVPAVQPVQPRSRMYNRKRVPSYTDRIIW
jgi:hypothetical protein